MGGLVGMSAVPGVDASWERIEDWSARCAPGFHAALNPPASLASIQQLERALGVALPPDLAAWWRRADGVDYRQVNAPRHLGHLIPDHCNPLSVAEALERRDMLRKVARRVCPPEWLSELAAWTARCDQDPAGTFYPHDASSVWPAAWLPIAADGGGGGLYADLRTGPLRGCLVRYARDGRYSAATWPSMAALWAHVAEALDTVTEEDLRTETDVTIGRSWRIPQS
jgi:cell wall assembly regulator SMI1